MPELADSARVVDVHEYGECDVPISDVLVDGRFAVHPEVARRGYFGIRMRDDVLRLTAGSAIGLIPLNERVTIHVHPRVPLRNFAHMLAVAEGDVKSLEIASRHFEGSPEAAESVLDAIARSFVACIWSIRQQGLHRSYSRFEGSTSLPRGRLMIGATVGRHTARGDETRVVASHFARSTDTGPNRLLRYAIHVLAARYRRLQGNSYRRLRALLNAADHMFTDVDLDYDRTFLQDPLVAGGTRMPSGRDRYVPAIALAKTIIRRAGVDLRRRDDLRMESLIFEMEDIFEAYVRNVLCQQAASRGLPLEVLSGRKGGKLLFDQPPSERAEPDIVVRARSRNESALAAIAEVKYIDRVPKREHIDQLIAYGASFRVPHAFLIHPSFEGGPRGLYRTAPIAPTSYHYYAIDLALDPATEEASLGLEFLKLVQPS